MMYAIYPPPKERRRERRLCGKRRNIVQTSGTICALSTRAFYFYPPLTIAASDPRVVNRIERCSIRREIHPIESEKQAEETKWVEGEGARGRAGGRVAPVC